jgi:glycosyltransferase involved in cell wall biosynthesis
MRIGIITGEYPPLQGGVGAFSDILAHRLQKLGHDIFVFSDSRTKQQSDFVPVTSFSGTWDYTALKAIQRWIDDNHLDIVNLQFQTAAYNMSAWIHFYPHFIKIPYVTTFHDLRFPYLFPKAGFLRDWIVMHLAKVSDGVITTNGEDWERVFPAINKMSIIIPIGSNILSTITDINRDEWRKKVNVEPNDILIVNFGFVNHSKGIDILLKAVAQLEDPSIKILMLGGRTGASDPTNQDNSEEIDKLIIELGLEKRVHWTGYVSDEEVSAYMQSGDMSVLPFRDGASMRRGSLLAALYQACAIITTYPTAKLPFDESHMILVPPEDVQALANAIRSLADNDALRIHLRNNMKTLYSYFDWDSIAQRTVEFFQQVLGENTP